jgi:NAD(P)H dehydrogenase (quinone)
MILVTGASGKTGKAVIKALAARNAPVRALFRNAAHRAPVEHAGASDIVIGDMDDEAALLRAMDGVEAVYHICPNVSPHEEAYAEAVSTAAEAAEVPRFVYHSVLHPQIEAMPHHWAKMRVEEMLFSSELNVTILQPTAYMQNTLGEWDRMKDEGVFRIPYPVETRLSLVDLDDVAAVAAQVLTEDGHGGATYELVGTLPHGQDEVAEIFSGVLGKPVRPESESVKTWQQRARDAGTDEHTVTTLTKMFVSYAGDGLKGNPNVLGWLLGRKPTTLVEFAARVVNAPPSS